MSAQDSRFTYDDGVSLKEYFGSRLDDLKVYLESRLDSITKATVVAYESMNKRLEGMNEFRDSLKDQAAQFARREEIDLQMNKVLEDLKMLRESKAMLEGKASQSSVNIAIAFALLSSVTAIFTVILRFIR